MSWKRSGHLVSGPPTSSNTNKLDSRFKPNLGGLNAFQREQQLSRRYGAGETWKQEGKTEWDVLKENHRFIRDDEEPGEVSWEERLARAYESKLFKEFALIDLKHFKSRRLALRWRTAEEVVEGIGEDTCASLRCKHHKPPPTSSTTHWEDDTPGPSISVRGTKTREKGKPALRSFELPFVYEEAGARKEALVKVRLCKRCEGKLTWKPTADEDEQDSDQEEQEEQDDNKQRSRGGRGIDPDRRADYDRRRRDASHGNGNSRTGRVEYENGRERRKRHDFGDDDDGRAREDEGRTGRREGKHGSDSPRSHNVHDKVSPRRSDPRSQSPVNRSHRRHR